MHFLTIVALFVAAAAAAPAPEAPGAVNQCATVPKGTPCVFVDGEGYEFDGVCTYVPGYPDACFPTGPAKGPHHGHDKRQTRNNCTYLGEKCIVGEAGGFEAVGTCKTAEDWMKHEEYYCSPL